MPKLIILVFCVYCNTADQNEPGKMITMIKKLLTFVALSAATIFTANAQTTVFEGNNSDKIPYRIPAIVQTSNEDILVFADKRHDGGDVGQNGSNASRIDVVYKRNKIAQQNYEDALEHHLKYINKMKQLRNKY